MVCDENAVSALPRRLLQRTGHDRGVCTLRCAGTVYHEWFYESVCVAVRNSALSGSAGEEAG